MAFFFFLLKIDERVLKYGSYSIAGYTDLTREKMDNFNLKTPDHPDVRRNYVVVVFLFFFF